MTGEWPSSSIDHKDLNRGNNKWLNLRLATRSQQNANRPAFNGRFNRFKGVSFHKAAGRWRAKIDFQRKSIWLGLYDTEEAAYEAYKEAAIRLHGEFARFH